MKHILARICELINVKTFVTVVVMIVFALLALRESIPVEQSVLIISTVITFYFGTQKQKHDDEIK